MARFLKLSVMIGTLFLLTGCLNERYGNCPIIRTNNVSLVFRLPDSSGNCTFSSDISVVDVAVYDQSGGCVTFTRVEKAALAGYQGVKLTLDPGTYNVVCWGNVQNNTVCNGVETTHEFGPHVTYSATSGGVAESCDCVYYGPREGRTRASVPGSYEMTVDAVSGHEGVISFTSAHRSMEIYIEGYSGTPKIEITGLPAGLNFHGMGKLTDSGNNPQTLTGVKTTTPVTIGGSQFDFALFNTFWFGVDDDIEIRVINPATGDIDFAIPLSEAIEISGDPNNIVIKIKIAFSGGGVSVTIPTWGKDDIEGGFGW